MKQVLDALLELRRDKVSIGNSYFCCHFAYNFTFPRTIRVLINMNIGNLWKFWKFVCVFDNMKLFYISQIFWKKKLYSQCRHMPQMILEGLNIYSNLLSAFFSRQKWSRVIFVNVFLKHVKHEFQDEKKLKHFTASTSDSLN